MSRFLNIDTHKGVGAKEGDLASLIARGLKKTFTPKNIKKMIHLPLKVSSSCP